MSQLRSLAGTVLAVMLLSTVGAIAVDAPQDLKWAALVPAETAQPARQKTFFSGSTPVIPGTTYQAPPPDQEAKWMSGSGRVTASSSPVPIVAELNGKRVRIGGYVVPLDFEAQKVTEFLLVPFVGACIHVPPPPANQIVYVKAPKGIELKGEFDPVYVTGTLSTEGQYTGLAETGYSITADAVDARKD
jgi:uncharacterized protein